MDEQKDFTQEISKSIFYLHKTKKSSSKQLESSIKRFLDSMRGQDKPLNQSSTIIPLWNKFYAEVQNFRDQQRVVTAYSPIITEETVNRIYKMNISLVLELNRVIAKEKREHQHRMDRYKNIQYTLFVIWILLLLYLFTEIQEIIAFIQKFSCTSKNIIKNSTIQGIEPIEEMEQKGLKEATKNYNYLIKKIDSSISYSTKSIEQTTKALEGVERDIEDFMKLLSTMHKSQSDELFQKEDAVIDSLETLMNLKDKLLNLKSDLDKLKP